MGVINLCINLKRVCWHIIPLILNRIIRKWIFSKTVKFGSKFNKTLGGAGISKLDPLWVTLYVQCSTVLFLQETQIPLNE